jgi:aminoglycoside 3-N-acetyltransferase
MNVQQWLKNLALELLSPAAIQSYKNLRKKLRRKQWEKRVKDNPEIHFVKSDLVEHLKSLGVHSGRDLIVHSAMSKIGFVEGGPDAVIDAILEVLGPEATLLMPVYPMNKSTIEVAHDPAPFDLVNDRSYMGSITENFRKRPGVYRSAHPTHSVAAMGPDAKTYTQKHHYSVSPCGEGSPFRLLSKKKGQILCIGTGIGKVTSHHTIEDLLPGFNIDVYEPEIFSKKVIFPDRHQETVYIKVHRPKLAKIRVDNDPETEAEVREAMLQAGILKDGRVGIAMAHLFFAHELETVLAERFKTEGTTIYKRSGLGSFKRE